DERLPRPALKDGPKMDGCSLPHRPACEPTALCARACHGPSKYRPASADPLPEPVGICLPPSSYVLLPAYHSARRSQCLQSSSRQLSFRPPLSEPLTYYNT